MQDGISSPLVMKNVKVAERKKRSCLQFVSPRKVIDSVVLEEWYFLHRLVEERCVKPPSLASVL